jgi:hypothetical protein
MLFEFTETTESAQPNRFAELLRGGVERRRSRYRRPGD